MTELYLIRHTQAEGNLYRMMQGHWDGEITTLGRAENDLLSERFRDIPLDAVYSSDLKRAVLTAEACARGKGIAVQTDRRLRELDLGLWETQFFGNVTYSAPEMVRKFLYSPGEWAVEGSETVYDVEKRAFKALTDIANAHPGQTVVIVSHGITLRCLLTKVLGLPYTGENLLPIFKNTSVTKLDYENGCFTVQWMNDASHLDKLTLNDWISVDALRDEPFNPEDDPELYCSCYRDTWQAAHEGSLRGYDDNAVLRAASERHRAYPGAIQKFYLNNEFAGLIDCDIQHGAHAGYGWISLLYLTEEFRGRGYGIQLLARAVVLYKQLGRHSIRLYASATNTKALAFYRREGFNLLQTEPAADGTLLLMEKPLGEERHVL
jgi:probable phosphoglycerate mutase